MLRFLLTLFFGGLLTASADTQQDIAHFDRQLQVAHTNALSHQENAEKALKATYLRSLSSLEASFKAGGNLDGVLACRKARAKVDPTAPKVDQPTRIMKPLVALDAAFARERKRLNDYAQKTIREARALRTRRLTAVLRGLVQRDEIEDAKLVQAALKYDPLTMPTASANAPFRFLTYDRSQQKWIPFSSPSIDQSTQNGVTEIRYTAGKHWILKLQWTRELKPGEHFSLAVQGAHSVELINPRGSDANAHFAMPESDKTLDVLIERSRDHITFRCDGEVHPTKYMSGSLRGATAQVDLVNKPLYPVISLKKKGRIRFRDATFRAP